MNKKFFNVVVIIICLIFAGTLIGTGAVLYQDYKIGQTSAHEKLDKLYRQTEEAISYYQYPNSDFIKSFTRAIGSPDYYYSIKLETPSQRIYDFPSEKSNKRGLTLTDSRRITEGNTIDLTLTVQIYTLPLNLIFSRTKIAFIIILATTLVSALCLLYLYLSGTSKTAIKEESDDFDFNDEETENSTTEEKTSEIEIKENTEINSNSENETAEKTEVETEVPSETDTVSEIEANTKSEKTIVIESNEETEKVTEADDNSETETNTETEKTSEDETADAETVLNKEVPEHEDLFSSVTGFCYEKYLVTRLESELARAASGEIDISLMLIQIPSIDFNSQAGIEICKQLINIFHYKDMLFEYKNDGIAIIYSNADIDKAMDNGELIYAELCSTLNNYNITQKPYVGIASRSLRFISGERLITEAEQALFHAKEDPDSPIIAFRVNPEKYRKYMAEKK